MRSILIWGLGVFLLSFASAARADIWAGGHGDIGALLDANNQLELHFHFEDDATALDGGTIAAGEYAPSAIQVFVPGPSIARPSGPEYDFLGAPTDQVWFLSQEVDPNNPNKPFLGFGLEDLDAADWTGEFTWSLKSVASSPAGGNFSLWQESSEDGVVPFMTTSNGIGTDDQFSQTAGGHEHFNLGFTRAGVFELEFEISGMHNQFGLLSNTATFTFISGVPEPSSMALLGCTCVGLGLRCVRRRMKITPKA